MAPPKKPSENVLDARKKIAKKALGAGISMHHSTYVYVPESYDSIPAQDLWKKAAKDAVLAEAIKRQQAVTDVSNNNLYIDERLPSNLSLLCRRAMDRRAMGRRASRRASRISMGRRTMRVL